MLSRSATSGKVLPRSWTSGRWLVCNRPVYYPCNVWFYALPHRCIMHIWRQRMTTHTIRITHHTLGITYIWRHSLSHLLQMHRWWAPWCSLQLLPHHCPFHHVFAVSVFWALQSAWVPMSCLWDTGCPCGQLEPLCEVPKAQRAL